MLKVTSLTHTIILQFAIILAPITFVLLYQTLSDVRQASSVKFELGGVVRAHRARDSYKVFLNGVADAVDTGSLSNRARQALEHTKDSLSDLQSWDRSFQSEPILEPINTLLNTTRRNQPLQELLSLQAVAINANGLLTALANTYEVREHKNTEGIIQAANRQVWIVVIATCITLASALAFVVQLINGLTEPLNRAVTLAENIAAGDFRAEKSIDTHRDIGGLLASLAAMRGGLRQAFLNLEKNEARLANAQRIASVGDWEMDIVSGSLTRSDEVYSIVGSKRGELTESSAIPLRIVHPDDKQMVEESLHAAQHRGEGFGIDFRIVLANGDTRVVHAQAEVAHDDAGKPIRISGTIQDISERKKAEEQIQHLALHDGLTGLPNRLLFEEQVDKALAAAQRLDQKLATLFFDLDRFKNINDSLGHHVGDALLKEVAKRVTHCLRKSDYMVRGAMETSDNTMARMGGDEFTVLLPNLSHAEDAARVARRIMEALAIPFQIGGGEVFVSASIGIALYPIDGSDVATLIKNSDAAMYHAKNEGRNNYQFFTESMNKEAAAKLSLENDLRKAVSEEQLVLYYQPQIDIATRNIFGVEALIRWRHPQRGLVPPVEFIPLAEERGLIVAISEWVLRTACAQAQAWHQSGLRKITVAVNMASPSFKQENLLQVVTDALEGSGLEAKYLELEVTESIMVHDMKTVLPTLKALKDIGIHLSIDDFGTGYSSLSYLQHFPIDALKIDQTFVSDIDENRGSAIVQAIIAMSASLNLTVIAEGVETESQAKFLLENGCHKMQGYLFSRPLPVDEMTRLLQQQNT